MQDDKSIDVMKSGQRFCELAFVKNNLPHFQQSAIV